MEPQVSVVVLAYGEEEWLFECVSSALASAGVAVEVILVDNGASPGAIASVRDLPGVTLLEPGRNTGFTGGMNRGAAVARGEVIVLLNSDAHVAPEALAILHREALASGGIAGALVLLDDQPDVINSAGNPLHWLGLSWAGRMGEPAPTSDVVYEPAIASGACLALPRTLWERLDGFYEPYFAYHEDVELSWRVHQLGLPVRTFSSARCRHHYEFGRTPTKMYLMERNRLLFLLTCHGRTLLATMALPLVALEAAMLTVAIVQGWGLQKVRGWWWLAGNWKSVKLRRTVVQAARTVPDGALVDMLTARFTAVQKELPLLARPLQWALAAWCAGASRVVKQADRRSLTRRR